GWQETVAVIQSGQVEGGALLVWELSRATRDKAVSAALEQTCVAARVKIGYHGRLHDPSTADGGFGLGLDALLAARESDMTSERTRRAVESRAAAGRPHGSLSYGYRKVVDLRTGATVGREIDPEQGPVVAEIVRRLLEREPADAIAADLNRRGVPTATGKLWRGGNLRILVRRPTYAGLRVHRGKVLEDVAVTWDPIISVADHHRLVAMFADPERDKFRNSTHVRHLGAGIFRCGREGCDGRMRVVHQEGRPNRYDCRVCHKLSRYQEPVDMLVEETVIERLQRLDAISALTQGDDNAAKAAAEAEAAKLQADLAEAQRLMVAKEITLADFAAARRSWEPQIEAAERRARPTSLPAVLLEIAGPQARQRWNAATTKERRTVLDALYRVTILPVGRGGQRFDPRSVRIEDAQGNRLK
ncbi:MAG: recombinase family protein, partial [Frondihabitans sp.]|nr:recombinase family protein [Frondihabitans sp.]